MGSRDSRIYFWGGDETLGSRASLLLWGPLHEPLRGADRLLYGRAVGTHDDNLQRVCGDSYAGANEHCYGADSAAAHGHADPGSAHCHAALIHASLLLWGPVHESLRGTDRLLYRSAVGTHVDNL